MGKMNLIKKIAATFVALLTLGFLLGQSYFGPNIKSYFGPSTLLAENNTSSSIPKDSIPSSKMTYGHFLEYLDMGWVTKVDLYENGRMAVIQASSPELGNRPQQIRVEIPAGASQLITKLRTSNVDFDAHTNQTDNLGGTLKFLGNFVLPLGLVGLVFLLFRSRARRGGGGGSNMGGGPGQLMNLGKAKNEFQLDAKTGVMFADVAGIEEAKEEFEEIVTFLKTPEKFTAVGAKIPRGVMLVGPPGTGKTLLAKAIAGEAGVPFLSVAGSEFVEMFIGIGASRVRDLFKKASENAPCIIFIDEIDAVGRERGAGVGGGNDEREQTLNQLLTEMDGFKENKGVIVVGATNRADILDAALLRPGRFDRQITVNLPDRLGRVEILNVHARNKPISKDVSLVQLANRTPGFSGADLANLLNEAAILATRYKKSSITKKEVNDAADRIIGGIAGTPLEDTKNKRLIAYHEVGRAISGSVLKSHDEVEKITVTPRGNSKGLTWFTPEEDQTLLSRSALLARIIGTLGGRAAELVVFGEAELTTGGSGELQQVTNLARQMVTRFGMSNIGPMVLEDENTGQVFLGGNMANDAPSTENLSDRIDNEVRKIIDYCEDKAIEIIIDNRVIIDLIVEKLLNVETMDGEEFRELLSMYTVLPTKNTPYVSKFT